MGRSRGFRVGGPGGLVSLSFEEKRLSHCVPVSVSPQLCCSTKVSEGNSGRGGEEPTEPQAGVWGRLEVRGGVGMGKDRSQPGLGDTRGTGCIQDAK